MARSIVWKCDANQCVTKHHETAWEAEAAAEERPAGWIEITIDASLTKGRIDKRENLLACCDKCVLEIVERYLIAPQYSRFAIERV